MKLFIVAVPLFNSNMAVEAYKLNYQRGDNLFGTSSNYTALDGAMTSPGLDILNSVGIDPFTGGKPIFVNVNKFHLLANTVSNCNIPPELLVCVLSNDLPVEAQYIDKCTELKSKGYSFALDNIEYSSKTEVFFRLADYVMYDVLNKDFISKLKVVMANNGAVKVVLYNIADKENFDSIKNLKNTLFGGNFYNQPLTKGLNKVSPLKANALQLLRIVGEDDFDIDSVSKIIQQDASISISLLKFINSPVMGLKGKVNSIGHAVAMMGQNDIRKWVTVAISSYLGDDRPNEITRLSLVRAKFAENLATAFEMGIHAPSLFLAGLFSLLDVILEMPMEQAINEISVNDKIREALVNRKGDFFEVLNLIYSYEQADWQNVSYIIVVKNISVDRLNKAFIDALIWYKELLEGTD